MTSSYRHRAATGPAAYGDPIRGRSRHRHRPPQLDGDTAAACHPRDLTSRVLAATGPGLSRSSSTGTRSFAFSESRDRIFRVLRVSGTRSFAFFESRDQVFRVPRVPGQVLPRSPSLWDQIFRVHRVSGPDLSRLASHGGCPTAPSTTDHIPPPSPRPQTGVATIPHPPTYRRPPKPTVTGGPLPTPQGTQYRCHFSPHQFPLPWTSLPSIRFFPLPNEYKPPSRGKPKLLDSSLPIVAHPDFLRIT